MTTATNHDVLDLLSTFHEDLTKQAEAESGETKPATTAARASENSADVKSDVPGQSVDETSETHSVDGAGEETETNDIGTQALSVDDAPKNPPKANKTDPGSSHPAEAGTEKYSSYTTSQLIDELNNASAEIAVFAKEAADMCFPADKDEKGNSKVDDTYDGDDKSDESEAKVKTESKENEMTTQEKAAMCDQLLGYFAGNEISDEILNKVASQVGQAEPQTEQQVDLDSVIQQSATELYKRADAQTNDLVEFLIGYKDGEKMAMEGMIPAEAMMGAEAAPDAPVDPAAAPAPDAAAAEEEAAVEELLAALEAQGVPLEALLGDAEGGAPMEEVVAGGDAEAEEIPGSGDAVAGEGEPEDAIDDAKAQAATEEKAAADRSALVSELAQRIAASLKNS